MAEILSLSEKLKRLKLIKQREQELTEMKKELQERKGFSKKLVNPLFDNKKAGFMDALVMALITGAIFGSVVTVLLLNI